MTSRRAFIAASAAAAFVVPTIITLDPASAAGLTSPPPEPPTPEPTPPTPEPTPPTGGRDELPRTGAPVDTLTAAGIAALAGGAAMTYWSAR